MTEKSLAERAHSRFAGKSAFVTGAASGVGRAVALTLAAEGAQVLAHDRDADGLAATAAAAAALAGEVRTRTGDLTSRDECFAAVAEAVGEFGRLDVLGNVAGIARGEHFLEVSEAAYRQMMAVNIDAYVFTSQAAIPHLLETSGSIINIASNSALMGQAYTVVYCISKGAVVQLTRALAMEFLKTGLRVNAIAPGMVDTALTQGYTMPDDVDFSLLQRYIGVRGATTAQDIAELFAFVASDDGRNIHGAILSSDGGMTTG
ncbi:MAG TPA: SDR family oxidoreductase [Mycobacteriales bacterium]|nr:SDR family oxidoreductase [Mycobacteriales bacterium]